MSGPSCFVMAEYTLHSEQVSQTFRARLFLILRVAGGAEDEHLVKEYDGFPLDAHGVPTFRPSARWYLVCRPAAQTTDSVSIAAYESSTPPSHTESNLLLKRTVD